MIFARASVESARLARDLAGLLDLGYSLVEALGKLESTCDGAFRQRLARLVEEVRGGSSLGQALSQDPGPFPATFTSSVALAEQGERSFPEALVMTAQVLEETTERILAARLASLYPAIVAAFLAMLVWLLVGALGIEFERVQQSLTAETSAVTEAYFQLSRFLRHPLGVVALFLATAGAWRFFTGASSWRFYLPIYGSWLASNQAVIFLRWSDHLIRLGMPLTRALEHAASACQSPLDALFRDVATKVEGGHTLGQALSQMSHFPPMAAWLVEQEEARESLDLRSVADFLSCELDTTEARGTAAIEPVALLAIGAVLLFVYVGTQMALGGVLDNLG